MFIDARWNQVRPPSGGPCQSMNARRVLLTLPPGGGRPRLVSGFINITLLAEGGRVSSRVL
jgi:hypothetical protein